LRFFSTEVALTEHGTFVVIDYVNETCDLRLQSLHYDGVPDQLVQNIASFIAHYVKEKLAKGQTNSSMEGRGKDGGKSSD
jgi:hypothetical protein